MLIWEFDGADYRYIVEEQWTPFAARLRDDGLICDEPRTLGDMVEVSINELGASVAARAAVMRVVQTEQRRRELEDGIVDDAVLVLSLLPRSDPPPSTATEHPPLGLLSFGYVAVVDEPSSLLTVMRAFMTSFGIDDDVRLTVFGAGDELVRSTAQSLLADFGSSSSAAAPPDIRSRPLDDLHLDLIHVLVSVDTASRLQPWLIAALERGVTVVAPRIGGSRDHLNDGNAWLVDCRFELSKRADRVSVGVVPDSLEKVLLHAARVNGAHRRVLGAREQVFGQRDEAAVAGNRLAALAKRQRSDAPLDRLPEELTAWVSTWNTKCGIASHVNNQLSSVDRSRHLVLAARTEHLLRPDGDNVVRCWDSSKVSNHLGDALSEIDRRGVTSVVIHFNWGFFHGGELSGFIKCLVERRVVVFVELHSTVDPPTSERLAHLAPALQSCDRVLVHSGSDVDRLLGIRVENNVAMLPHGVLIRPGIAPARRPSPTPLVATFGYSFPNKGLVEFVRAVALLKQRGVRLRVLMLNAEHPVPASAKTVEKVRREIESLGLNDDIDFRSDYLDDEQCIRMLSEADLIVNPYQESSESASGATRYGMAARRPLLVTPLDIFRDLENAVFRTNDITVESLAQGIEATLDALTSATPAASAVAEAASDWLRAHDYAPQAPRLARLATCIRRNRAVLVQA